MPVTVELQPVSELIPFAQNARIHKPAAVARLVKIIGEMGWTNPILVDDDGIVAGHKRRLAALEIYKRGGVIRLPGGDELPEGMVPVLDVSGWTEAQRRAYIIADNQTTLESDWDGETLRLELAWLKEDGDLDIGLTGFDGAALAKALSDGTATNAEDEWQGMPEFDQKDKKAFRSMALHFPDQKAVDDFAALIGQKITDKTRFVWFPEIEIERYADKRYSAE